MARLRIRRSRDGLSDELDRRPFIVRPERADLPAVRFMPLSADGTSRARAREDEPGPEAVELLAAGSTAHPEPVPTPGEARLLNALFRLAALEREVQQRKQSIGQLRRERADISSQLSHDRGRLSAMADLVSVLHANLEDFRTSEGLRTVD